MWNTNVACGACDAVKGYILVSQHGRCLRQGTPGLQYTLISYCSAQIDDQCVFCFDGMSLSADRTRCEVPLVPVKDCLSYRDFILCDQCERDFQLAPSKTYCFEVGRVVRNCFEYHGELGNEKCSVCDPSFLLVDGVCVQRDTRSAPKNCLSLSSPNTCGQCQEGMYLNKMQGRCDEVSTPLPGCLLYLDQFRCRLCTD